MNTQSYKQRHAEAMLYPESPEEHTIVNLTRELAVIADRYSNDSVMIVAVEKLGSSIIRLLDGGVGRLDQSLADKQVRDIVARAGGDANEL